MIYLITGAAGFIASKVAEQLLDDGHVVHGIDNLNTAYDVRLKEWRLQQLDSRPGFHFHQGDICDRPMLASLITKLESPPEAVINLAAWAGVRASLENPWICMETNLIGTLNLLEMCHDYGIKKFILASTSSLYGENSPMPYREQLATDNPLSPYAASKKAAEALCYSYHHLYNLDVTVFRYFTVYGPAGRPDMSLFRFVQWISEDRPVIVFGDGKQSRDFTYVDDIARGTIAGLKPLGYEVINLGSDTPVVLMDAIHMIEDMLGKSANLEYQPRHSADMLSTWADIKKAQELLDWRPEVSLEKGMQQLINWYRDNRDWAKNVRT